MNTEERTAIRRVGVHAADLAAELRDTSAAMDKAHEAVDALANFMAQPRYRRALKEYELGYAVPAWVHRVWEQQARQFGSGNGRSSEHGR